MSTITLRKLYEEIYHPDNYKDGRCKICKQHKYIVLDYHREWYGIVAMHSFIEEGLLGAVGNATHWWLKSMTVPPGWEARYKNFTGKVESECLQYYKEIK